MLKNIHLWLPEYLCGSPRRASLASMSGPIHVVFSIVDHFEPRWNGASPVKARGRTQTFLEYYGQLTRRHHDSTGVVPKYSFFYPIDEYSKECVDLVGDFCRQGLGELEVHLHHKDDTESKLREKLRYAVDVYKSHGLLSTDRQTGETRYGFIHGNWSLCNSRPDGKWCGVNDELRILRETGCYADFTLPSAPSNTQTSKINSVYYAKSSPLTPKGHDRGKDVILRSQATKNRHTDTADTDASRSFTPLRSVQDDDVILKAGSFGLKNRPEASEDSDSLMIIQGPLMLNWRDRKIENSALMASNPVNDERIRLWVNAHIHVQGRPEWIFIKLHNHGCKDDQLTDKFFSNLDWMFTHLESNYNDGKNYQLHYATAREMYNIIKAAESGESGTPAEYRDYAIVSNLIS